MLPGDPAPPLAPGVLVGAGVPVEGDVVRPDGLDGPEVVTPAPADSVVGVPPQAADRRHHQDGRQCGTACSHAASVVIPVATTGEQTDWQLDPDSRPVRVKCAECGPNCQSVCAALPVVPHRMFTARATTSVARVSEIRDSAITISFAHRLMADTSVGPNAIAVLNDSAR